MFQHTLSVTIWIGSKIINRSMQQKYLLNKNQKASWSLHQQKRKKLKIKQVKQNLKLKEIKSSCSTFGQEGQIKF